MFRIQTGSRTLLAAVMTAALLGGAPGLARAGVLASGYLGGTNAVRLSCRVWNVGSAAVTITSAKVYTDSGSPFTDTNTCTGSPLLPGASCVVSGPVDTGAGLVKVSGGTQRLRGVCQMLAANSTILASTEMR